MHVKPEYPGYFCDFCYKYFETDTECWKHTNEVHYNRTAPIHTKEDWYSMPLFRENKWKCSYCEVDFDDFNSCFQHQASHRGWKVCENCNIYFYPLNSNKHVCVVCERKLNLMPLPKIEVLQRSFNFEARKTLKLTPKAIVNLNDAIADAREFLKDSVEYSRIEFRYGNFYYVVARLKEGE